MPIYEYRCNACDHEFELFQQRGDDDPRVCPECDREDIKRLISNTSFQLKGSGWYETDYARDDESEASESSEASGETEETSETTSDTSTTEEAADDPEAA